MSFSGEASGTAYTLDFGDGATPVSAAENINCVESDPNCAENAVISVAGIHVYATSSDYIATLSDGAGDVLATTSISVQSAPLQCGVGIECLAGTVPQVEGVDQNGCAIETCIPTPSNPNASSTTGFRLGHLLNALQDAITRLGEQLAILFGAQASTTGQ